MAATAKKAFDEFLTNLEITDWQTDLVSTRRKNVVDVLKKELSLHPDESKLIGSYDRHTLTRYLSEADIDVMVILHYGNNKGWDNSEGSVKALDKFKQILDLWYPNTVKQRDRNCITMKFAEFQLDIVPAFSWEGGYYKIPDTSRGNWIPTNPLSFAEAITRVNKNMNGSFIPLIKAVKAWNRNIGHPLRSFHIECMMYNRYSSYTQGFTYSSMLKVFFENLPFYLSSSCYDPIMNDRVDTYLDNQAVLTERTKVIQKAKEATAQAEEAHADEEKYPSIAIREWKQLLGEFFPNYG